MDKILTTIYYDVDNPAGFSSVSKLYNAAKAIDPSINKEQVREWLRSEFTYTLHHPARRIFNRNKIIVNGKNVQAQADLVDMSNYAEHNDGYKFILTFIDCFSRVAHARAIKSKSAANVSAALESIIEDHPIACLQTDRGTEFVANTVTKMLKSHDIHSFVAYNQDIKCAIVERFNRTLKTRMFRYFTSKGTRKYIDVLQKLVDAYNKSIHSTLGITPSSVSEANQERLFKRMYGFANERALRSKALLMKRGEPQFRAGDIVRKKYYLSPMEHRFLPNYTDVVYKISHIIRGYPRYKYKLKTYDGKEVDGTYYSEELILVNDPIYRIEKIVKERGDRVLVKWVGYGSEHNSWIKRSDVIDL